MKKRTGNDRWIILFFIALCAQFIGMILVIISCCVQGEARVILSLIGVTLIGFNLGVAISTRTLGDYISDEKVKEDDKK